MTEEEAKEKWCPFARVAFVKREIGDNNKVRNIYQSGAVSFNRGQVGHSSDEPLLPAGATCVGSDCGVWEWDGPEPPSAPQPATNPHWDPLAQQTATAQTKPPARHGRCGLIHGR